MNESQPSSGGALSSIGALVFLGATPGRRVAVPARRGAGRRLVPAMPKTLDAETENPLRQGRSGRNSQTCLDYDVSLRACQPKNIPLRAFFIQSGSPPFRATVSSRPLN